MNKKAPKLSTILIVLCWLVVSCDVSDSESPSNGEDQQVTTRGTVEVTARLERIPEGAIFKRDLYDYAAILKYKVIKVHRGEVAEKTIYVGHYNPFKSRTEAADQRVKDIGGNLERFESGQLHRMALEVPIDDHFMGGIINKYFGESSEPIYFAVWTNFADE